MARAEPAAIVTARVGLFLAKGDTPKVRTNADNNQPRLVDNPARIRLSVDKGRLIVMAGGRNLRFSSSDNKNRLAAPFDRDPLTDRDHGQIDIHRRQGKSIGRRIHAIDKGPGRHNATRRDEST